MTRDPIGAYRTADNRCAAYDKTGGTWIVTADEAERAEQARAARKEAKS